MLHTKFVGSGPQVPEKKIFEGFLPYLGMAAILIILPASCHQIFISLYLKAFIQTLVQISKVVFKKIQFEFLYVHMGQDQEMTLTLLLAYFHIFN